MKPLLLGEAPGPRGGTCDPLGKRTAKRLCDFADFMPEMDGEDPWRAALAKRFELRNILAYSPPKVGKGMLFPLDKARAAVLELPLGGRIVVCLGKRVAEAVEIPRDYFRWTLKGTSVMIAVPHPSGINRVLNDPKMRARTGQVLRVAATMGDP
jgi:hypothetical protein